MPGKVVPLQPRPAGAAQGGRSVWSSPCSPCSARRCALRVAARGSGPPCAEVEPSRSPAFPLPISNRADADRELRHDRNSATESSSRTFTPTTTTSPSASAATRSATSRRGMNRTTRPSSTGTRQNSPKPTFHTKHRDRGRPTWVGPFRTYHQAARDQAPVGRSRQDCDRLDAPKPI